MTAQTVAGPAYHQGCITVTAGAYPSRVITTSRIGMTEGAVVAMDSGYHTGAAVSMTVKTVVSDQGVIPVGSGMAAIHTVIASFLSAGDHVVCGESVYGPVTSLLSQALRSDSPAIDVSGLFSSWATPDTN